MSEAEEMREALRVISTAGLKNPCRITYVLDNEDGEGYVDFTVAADRPGTAHFDFGFDAAVLREFVRLAGQALAELDAAHTPVPATEQ